MRSEHRTRILENIATARLWLDDLVAGRIADTQALASRGKISERQARMTLSLTFLAPDVVARALDGTLPRGLTVSQLTDPPFAWAEQRRRFGLA
jgi:hypothetical protein